MLNYSSLSACAKRVSSFLLLGLFSFGNAFAQKPEISVDLNQVIEPMKPIWAWFGYDEPNYTYMKDGKKLLTEISKLSPAPVYVRTHSLLVTGDGTAALKWGSTNAYTEDTNGKPVYNWAIIDSIFDTYVKRGMKPLAQIGFMPQALSTHPEPYRHHWKPGDPYNDIITGWAYPPADYDKWRELVYQWVRHSVERYGQKEVESWYWEVWNEPNGAYWKGTREEFFKLYDYAADGLKKALPTARIGGINIAGTRTKGAIEWTREFIEHCISGKNYATGRVGSPLDAVLFHAKGWPRLVDGFIRMDMAPQLQDIRTGIEIAQLYKQTRDLPLIVGESDPEGCAACGMATNPENAYRNGVMYSSYTAASFARKYEVATRKKANLLGVVSWSFEFEGQPWFYGFRDLATNGVDKPVLNVFRMLGMMKGNRIQVRANRMVALDSIVKNSVHGALSDIGGLAATSERSASVMVWNYHDDDKPAPDETVALKIAGLTAKKVNLNIYMIDKNNSNAYEVWKKMGSPQQPTAAQISELEKAGQLSCVSSRKIEPKAGSVSLDVKLQRHAVALVLLKW